MLEARFTVQQEGGAGQRNGSWWSNAMAPLRSNEHRLSGLVLGWNLLGQMLGQN